VAADEQDPAGRRARQRERTGVVRRSEPDGVSTIRLALPDAEASYVLGTAEAIADAAWRRRNPEGHEREPSPEGYAQRLADAFVEMAKLAREGGGSAGVAVGGAPEVVVVVDAARLGAAVGLPPGGGAMALPAAGGDRSGFGATDAGGRCLGEQGAVPIGEVERLLCHAAISLGLADGGGDVLNLGRAARVATARQKLALVARDGPTCAVPGCTVPWRRTQAHHVLGWTGRLQGRTDLRELVHLCVGHHHDVHEGGWSLRWHLDSWQVYPPGVAPPAGASLLAHGKPRLGGPALGQAVA
jgi:hypothetical protein